MSDQIIAEKYRVVRLLGRGGMGAVYEARHLGTGRRVALKVIVAEAMGQGEMAIRRFEREARASGEIETQHVVQVFDTGVDRTTGSPFLAMEYLSGEDLSQVLRRAGVLPPELVLRMMAQACLGLQRAHEAGIVHRDIKSANLFLAERDGGEVIVKLLDFGIAKVLGDRLSSNVGPLTQTGDMIGSPMYMSPEQVTGAKDLDARTDIWSLGVVMYEALTGGAPNRDQTTIGALILAICSKPPAPIEASAPWVPAPVAAIVRKALALAPADRFQSAAEMHAAIMALLPAGASLRADVLRNLPPAPRVEAPVAQAASAPIPTGTVAYSTTAGLGASRPDTRREPAPGPPRGRWVLPVTGAALAAAAVVGVAYRAHLAGSPAKPDVSAAASAPSEPSSSLPAAKPVSLAVAADARVDVDGVSSPVHDGRVDVPAAEAAPPATDANGPAPTRAPLPVPSPARHPATAATPATPATAATAATPAVTAVTERPAAPPTPPPPPRPAPTTKNGAPAIDRSF